MERKEMRDEIPNCPHIKHCHCYPEEEKAANAIGTTHCVCGESEKALRGWINNRIQTPMTPAQREWCLKEIDNVEGFDRLDYLNETDAQLALGVISAWKSYCEDKGLL